MKKIKILFIGLTNNLGGIEVFGRDLILKSDPEKFDFTIMLGDKVTTPFQDELVKHGVKIVRFGFRKNGYRKCLNDIRSIYENGHYDIIHINLMTYSPFELVKYACEYSGATVVVHSHNTGYKSGHLKARFMHSIGKKIIRSHKYNRIACGTDAGKYLFNDQDFRVFYNGIDFDKFKFSQKNRDKIRKELGVSKTDFVIGDIASFLPQKNQKFLIKIFAKIRKRKKNAKMILVGVGQELEKCKRLAKKNGVEKEIIFLERRNDVEKIYSALDVYAMPSTSEGLSIALCEAQVNGLPCITSCGVCRESDISGNVSFLKLASADLWADKILSASVKRDNKLKILSDFNINNAINKFYKYYESLVNKKVTIVIPTYNSEKTIERCVDSVLSQNYTNMELLVVDDGSNDMTVDIVKRYVKDDKRLKLICQRHKGPNFARRKGVDLANGNYLMFIDADDYIEKDTVGILIDKFNNNDVDVIRFNAKKSSGKVAFPILLPGESDVFLKHDEVMDLLLNTYKLNSLCFQCYKTKDMKKVLAFDYDLEFGEDFLVNLALHKKTKKMLVISDIMYHYCNNPKSTTQNKGYDRVMKNIADRIFVSLVAMDSAGSRATYNQLKMVKSAIMDIVKVKKYNKGRFLKDLSEILTDETFSSVNLDEINRYIKLLSMIERIKNQKIINAIVLADYEYIWKYARVYKKVRRIRI